MAQGNEEQLVSPATARSAEGTGISVVLGVEKPLGRTLVERLLSEPGRVRGVFFERQTGGYVLSERAEAVVVDPSEAHNIIQACGGANTVYDCYEPNYSLWKKMWPQVTSNVVLASIEVNATLVFASHLLNSESENERQEREVLRANESNLIKAVVARVPQLFGVGVINPLWKLIYNSALEGTRAHWVGDLEVPRSMLDVEDAAEAIVQLGRSPNSIGRAWSVASPETITGRQLIEFAFKAEGREPLVGSLGRRIAGVGGFLATDAREVQKTPYDYYVPFVLDGKEFAEVFPTFHFTPAETSVSRGIKWYKRQMSAT
jgi:hypothetical protein